MRVLCGIAVLAIGCSKSSNAVGPKDGKRRGCLVRVGGEPAHRHGEHAGNEPVHGVPADVVAFG